MKELRFFDSSLRDGSHAVHQQISQKNIEDYCSAIDEAGLYTVIVGHGNGLGASSIQMGLSLVEEKEMLKIAKKYLKHTRLGTFVTIGMGTIENDIKSALESGVQLFCISSHCTEADTTRKHIEYLALQNVEVYGVLMNYHLCTTDILLHNAMEMESYGVDGVIIMDSAGASTPDLVKRTFEALQNKLSVSVGFHAHNTMSMAVSNSYLAMQYGANIIDGTVCGFGAGAGNCQLEALIALLEKSGYTTGIDLYRITDVAGNIVRKEFGYQKGVDETSIISGYAGVVSTFRPRVERISKKYHVDPRDVFVELGKHHAITGQDDLILEIAKELAGRQKGC